MFKYFIGVFELSSCEGELEAEWSRNQRIVSRVENLGDFALFGAFQVPANLPMLRGERGGRRLFPHQRPSENETLGNLGLLG